MVHGPAGADEAYLPVRASVTRGPNGSCATPITVAVVAAKKMINTWQSMRALTVSTGMSRRMCGGNGASVQQVVGSFPTSVERVYQHPVDQITREPTPRARTH